MKQIWFLQQTKKSFLTAPVMLLFFMLVLLSYCTCWLDSFCLGMGYRSGPKSASCHKSFFSMLVCYVIKYLKWTQTNLRNSTEWFYKSLHMFVALIQIFQHLQFLYANCLTTFLNKSVIKFGCLLPCCHDFYLQSLNTLAVENDVQF